MNSTLQYSVKFYATAKSKSLCFGIMSLLWVRPEDLIDVTGNVLPSQTLRGNTGMQDPALTWRHTHVSTGQLHCLEDIFSIVGFSVRPSIAVRKEQCGGRLTFMNRWVMFTYLLYLDTTVKPSLSWTTTQAGCSEWSRSFCSCSHDILNTTQKYRIFSVVRPQGGMTLENPLVIYGWAECHVATNTLWDFDSDTLANYSHPLPFYWHSDVHLCAVHFPGP